LDAVVVFFLNEKKSSETPWGVATPTASMPGGPGNVLETCLVHATHTETSPGNIPEMCWKRVGGTRCARPGRNILETCLAHAGARKRVWETFRKRFGNVFGTGGARKRRPETSPGSVSRKRSGNMLETLVAHAARPQTSPGNVLETF
jgi:hypothetical protein